MSTRRARGGYKPREHGSLKKAQADLVEAAGGVNTPTRIGSTSLADATDPNNLKRYLPADVIVELERLARDPIVTRYLALQQDCLLVPLHSDNAQPYPLALAKFTTEAGQVLAAGGMAMRDGKVNRSEAMFLKQQALECARPLASLIADCDRVITSGNGSAV